MSAFGGKADISFDALMPKVQKSSMSNVSTYGTN